MEDREIETLALWVLDLPASYHLICGLLEPIYSNISVKEMDKYIPRSFLVV